MSVYGKCVRSRRFDCICDDACTVQVKEYGPNSYDILVNFREYIPQAMCVLHPF